VRRIEDARGVVGAPMSDKGKIDEIMAEIGKFKAIVGQETFDRRQREVWEKEAAKHPPVDEAGLIVPGALSAVPYALALLEALRAAMKH
jgi:hypothetical protein